MHLGIRLINSLFSRLGLRLIPIRSELFGRELWVDPQTIRAEPDKDDAWMWALALRATIVFDIGANIGQSAVLMLQSPSIKRILLVDPNPKALMVAADNLIRNHLVDRAQFKVAFVDERADETIRFWTVGVGAAGSKFAEHAKTAARRGASMQVQTTTLDHLCEQFDLLPDLIKIDVEGAESEVLAGTKQCAGRRVSRFFIEVHANDARSIIDNTTMILDWCAKMGYRAWYLTDGVALTDPQQVAHRGRYHVLLQPIDWTYPDFLVGITQGASLRSVVRDQNDS